MIERILIVAIAFPLGENDKAAAPFSVSSHFFGANVPGTSQVPGT